MAATHPVLSRRTWIAAGAAALAWRAAAAAEPFRPHVTAVAFAPGGREFVVGSQAGVFVCDSQAAVTRSLETGMDHVHDLRFSPDGRALAVAGGMPGQSGMVEMLDWPGGTLRQRIEQHDDVVYQVDFASDGSTWVAASGDETCSVWETENARSIARFTQHSGAVLAVAMLPGGSQAVSASRDETLRVWETRTGEALRTMHNHSRQVDGLAMQPAAAMPTVASASADGTIRFWQPSIGRMVRFTRLPSEPLCIAWVAAGTRLIAGCRDGKVRVVDPITVAITDTRELGDGWLFAIDADPADDRRVIVGGSRGLVRMLTL